jgi:CHAT domain-containing protein
MPSNRLISVIPLTLSFTLSAMSLSYAPTIAAENSPSASEKPPVPKSPAFDAEAVSQLLDQGRNSDAIQQVEIGWKRQYEEYYHQSNLTQQQVEIPEIPKVLQQIQRKTGKKTALVYIISSAKHLDLILVTPNGPMMHQRSEVPRVTLLQNAKAFRTAVSDATTAPADYLSKAQTLYQWMIAPLEPALKAQQIDTLIFCLGGGLRSLPIAALHDGQQFLVEQYSLAIIPAFNLLNRRPAQLQNERVLAMGASEFKQQSALPAVPLELSSIIDQPKKGEAWLNQDFTVAHLKARRTAYPFGIIHLATHAEFLPGAVQQSYIQFWDAPLTLNQIKDLNLRSPAVHLLVLSACQTALGDIQAELGFAGLAVQSGSRAALASLWAVSDVGTLTLMDEFYNQLQTAPIKAEALRQTQMAMIKGTLKPPSALKLQRSPQETTSPPSDNIDISHPYYWSAFTLIGNPW